MPRHRRTQCRLSRAHRRSQIEIAIAFDHRNGLAFSEFAVVLLPGQLCALRIALFTASLAATCVSAFGVALFVVLPHVCVSLSRPWLRFAENILRSCVLLCPGISVTARPCVLCLHCLRLALPLSVCMCVFVSLCPVVVACASVSPCFCVCAPNGLRDAGGPS